MSRKWKKNWGKEKHCMSYKILSIFFNEISIQLTIKWEFGGVVLVSLKSPHKCNEDQSLSFRPILWELLDFEEFFSLNMYFVKVCYNMCSADTRHTSRVVVNTFGGYNLSFFENVCFSRVKLTKISYLWEKIEQSFDITKF